MSEEATAKLKKVIVKKSKQIKSLSDQLKEEKRAYRTSNNIMESIEKKADKAALELRLLQSDLAVANEMATETLERAREEHNEELNKMKQQFKEEHNEELNKMKQQFKEDVRKERNFAKRKADDKLQKAKEEHSMVVRGLQNLLDEHKTELKQQCDDCHEQLESLERHWRKKLEFLADALISDINEKRSKRDKR